MRNAHRPKALPNKKLPRGIERQDELIELIEKRFHQEDLIRDALCKKGEIGTAEQLCKSEAISAEETMPADGISAAENAPSAEETISASETPATAEATAPLADSTPSAEETTSAGETPVTAEATAPLADSTPSAEETISASETPVTAEATAPLADAPETVTIRWHGKHETITDPRIWLTVFDTVRDAGDAVTREVAHRRFHGESYWKTCDALYLSTGTYYHHVRAILHYAFACAVYHRLIDPRPKHDRPKAK